MEILEVLNPVALEQRGSLNVKPINKRPSTLDGKKVGLLWSGYTMGDVALQRVGEMLKERFTDVETKMYVGGSSSPSPASVLEQAAAESDVVVGATAD